MAFRKVLHVLIPVVVLVATGCQPAPAPPEEKTAPPPDVSGINALRDAVAAAYNANDAAAVASLYTDDGILMPGHEATLEGKAAIQAHLQTLFDAYTVNLTITPAETQVLDDWAYDRGTYTVTVTPKAGGDAMEEAGRYVVILKRDADGSWKVHRDIDNSPTPLPNQ